jgi:hypothetical protein
MKPVNFSGSSEDKHPPLTRSEAIAAGCLAFIITAVSIIHHSYSRTLDTLEPDASGVPVPAAPVDNKADTKKEKLLEEGDDGLSVLPEDDTIRFVHKFSLHPLKQFPNDERYAARLREFVDRWLTANVEHRGDWIAAPVIVSRTMVPDEQWPIPNSVWCYTLQCTAIEKDALNPGNRLLAGTD